MMMPVLAALAIVSQNPIVSGDRSIVSKCEVSSDNEYGYTKPKPIKVGGTPMGGPARQRRYLQALAGPAGQPIAFKRLGSLPPDADNIILDVYHVTYAGVEKPIELYLDLYRWDPPKAPKGFVCATEIGLAPPVAGPGGPAIAPPIANLDAAYERLIDLVLASSDTPRPIPLQPGSTERGMIFDLHRLLAITKNDLIARREKPSKEALGSAEPSLLVVVNPASCGAAERSATSIAMISGPSARQIGPIGGLLTGDDLRNAVPGVELRAGASGMRFGGNLPPNSTVIATFEDSSCQPVKFPITSGSVLGRRITSADGVPPAGLTATPAGYIGNMTLKVNFRIGPDGVPFAISVVSGDARYAAAAIEAVSKWRYELPLANGEPVWAPTSITTDVVFR